MAYIRGCVGALDLTHPTLLQKRCEQNGFGRQVQIQPKVGTCLQIHNGTQTFRYWMGYER
jgi:hypothetical protein